MLMKGKPTHVFRPGQKIQARDPDIVAAQVLRCIANDSERLGRFLALTGLDPMTLRQQAGTSEFLVAILDYVLADESLLIEIAGELEMAPETIADAQRRLSPVAPDDP